jgi:hypothetical protein
MTRKLRKGVLLQKFDNYINESEDSKADCQDIVFDIYYERNDFEIELTLEEIREDIIKLEHAERYERCQMLKDILDRFE